MSSWMQRFLNLARITTIISEQTIQNIPRLASFGNLIEDGFSLFPQKNMDKISQTKIMHQYYSKNSFEICRSVPNLLLL